MVVENTANLRQCGCAVADAVTAPFPPVQFQGGGDPDCARLGTLGRALPLTLPV